MCGSAGCLGSLQTATQAHRLLCVRYASPTLRAAAVCVVPAPPPTANPTQTNTTQRKGPLANKTREELETLVLKLLKDLKQQTKKVTGLRKFYVCVCDGETAHHTPAPTRRPLTDVFLCLSVCRALWCCCWWC